MRVGLRPPYGTVQQSYSTADAGLWSHCSRNTLSWHHLLLVVWAYAHTFQSYGPEEKESTTPAFMGPLAMQHGGSRVVAPPDGEEAPHQTLQEEVPHSCEVKFVLFLWCFQHHQGFAYIAYLFLDFLLL